MVGDRIDPSSAARAAADEPLDGYARAAREVDIVALAPSLDDGQAIERAVAGDLDAFDALVVRHAPRAFRVALRLMGQREDAEDLVQEAFVLAFRHLDRFEAGQPFCPWFHRILMNRGLNLRRARARRATEPIPDDVAAGEDSPARLAERNELADRLGAALANLPERERTIVELFELEGFDSGEIAQILEIPRGTIRWLLHRARATLRQELHAFHGSDA
jgi:RNA polymerase sigma-70 factor (ECF subfamily)